MGTGALASAGYGGSAMLNAMGRPRYTMDPASLTAAILASLDETDMAILQSGGARKQRGGYECGGRGIKATKALIVVALAGVAAYAGAGAAINSAISSVTGAGSYLWSLVVTGTEACTVTPGAASLSSEACLEAYKLGAAVRGAVATGTIELPGTTKAVIAALGTWWAGGAILKTGISAADGFVEVLAKALCPLLGGGWEMSYSAVTYVLGGIGGILSKKKEPPTEAELQAAIDAATAALAKIKAPAGGSPAGGAAAGGGGQRTLNGFVRPGGAAGGTGGRGGYRKTRRHRKSHSKSRKSHRRHRKSRRQH